MNAQLMLKELEHILKSKLDMELTALDFGQVFSHSGRELRLGPG